MMILPLVTDQISEGYVILITGLLIVFSALLTLSLFFKYGLPVMLYIYKVITKRKDKKITEISLKSDKNFKINLNQTSYSNIFNNNRASYFWYDF